MGLAYGASRLAHKGLGPVVYGLQHLSFYVAGFWDVSLFLDLSLLRRSLHEKRMFIEIAIHL